MRPAVPPEDASPPLVYWPTLVGARHISARVHLGDETVEVPQRVEAGGGGAPVSATINEDFLVHRHEISAKVIAIE